MVLKITPVERAVLQLLADGNTTTAIARRLRLSERAVDTLLRTLVEKMGAANPVAADARRQRLPLIL